MFEIAGEQESLAEVLEKQQGLEEGEMHNL